MLTVGSAVSMATPSIRMMAPTLMVGLVQPRTPNGKGLHLRVAACTLPLYDFPKGRWAHWVLETLTDLWVGVVERLWNSERPLVFQACALWRVRGISRFHDVKPIIWGRLDAWDTGHYVALVREVEEATLDIGGGGGGPSAWMEGTTSIARKYHNMVLGGKVRATCAW
jgi:hypothetical protein